jgi:hypothetical protein
VKVGLFRRLAAASVLAEALEAKAMNGGEINLGEFCNLASTQVRIASRVGITRQAKNVTPIERKYRTEDEVRAICAEHGVPFETVYKEASREAEPGEIEMIDVTPTRESAE